MIIGEIIRAEVGVEIEDPAVEEGDITKTIGMTETVEEIGENINKDTMTIGDKGKRTPHVVAESSGTIMTIGTEERTDKAVVEGRSGIEEKVKVMGIEVGVIDGTHMNNTLPKVTLQTHTIKIQTTTGLCLWDTKHRIHHHQLSIRHTHNNTKVQARQHDHSKHQMFVNYAKALGHYDYQCQFASDFLSRTQKAFSKARSYNHTDPSQAEWATGENDNEDPNDQPFQ